MMTRTVVDCGAPAATCGRSSGVGAMKNGNVTPPSTCVSDRILPWVRNLTVTGGSIPGTLAEARRRVCIRGFAFLSPWRAMEPRYQMTGSPLSKVIVTQSRNGPLADLVAMAAFNEYT